MPPETESDSRRPRTLGRLARSFRDAKARHDTRRRPTGFTFAFADRIDHLDPVRWDALTREQTLFLRRDVLRVIEREGSNNLTPRYAMMFRDGQPVAALAAQVVEITGARLQREKARPDPAKSARSATALLRRLVRPAEQAARRVEERLLVAGNLLSWGFHGIAFAAEEAPASLWPGIAEALYRMRRAERLSGEANLLLLKDVTPGQVGLEALRDFSYRPLETEPNMVLELRPEWQSYDQYLGALDAKYRRNAKEHVRKLAAAGCVIERLPDLAPHGPRLHELYLSVQGNAAVRPVTLKPGYLPALAVALGDRFRCHAVLRDGEILGFVTSLNDGPTAIGYYIGFDRSAAAAGLPIYLALLHSTIGDALEWGCRRLSLGRTALEPKAALGAKPEVTQVWLRHRVPALNWMIRGLLQAVPHDEPPERNPFKKAPASPSNPNPSTNPDTDSPG